MTKRGKSGIKVFYNYKNKKYIISMGRQNVTIRTFDLISPSCNSLWVVKRDMVVPDEWWTKMR